jgi:hypothetical protein
MFKNSTVLRVSGNVVSGMFNMKALGGWDRVSAIGPLRGPATASAPLNVVRQRVLPGSNGAGPSPGHRQPPQAA